MKFADMTYEQRVAHNRAQATKPRDPVADAKAKEERQWAAMFKAPKTRDERREELEWALDTMRSGK